MHGTDNPPAGGEATGKDENPATERSLALVYDLAIRSYDYTDRRYDLIGTRAGALIGFTSLLVTGAATVVQRLAPYPAAKWAMVVLFGSFLAYLLYHSVQAYRAREVEGLPNPRTLYETYAAYEETAFRKELIALISNARDTYVRACVAKSRHLRKGLVAFVAMLAILVPSLMLIPEHPSPGASIGNDGNDERD